VLGDAMAMPIGSMVEKFRDELEAEIEAARERAGIGSLDDVVPLGVADEHAGPLPVH
jgi:NADH-quinone oxidoreductase subunit F